MKKFWLLALLAFIGLGASAQHSKGDMAAGINLGFGTEISSFELGAKFQYGISNPIRAEVAFNYFFENDFTSMWDIELTGHYLFNVAEKFSIYPLVGITYTNIKVSYLGWSASEGRFGANLGAGAEYYLNQTFSIGLEAKYQLIADFDQAIISVGATYRF